MLRSWVSVAASGSAMACSCSGGKARLFHSPSGLNRLFSPAARAQDQT